MAEKDLVNFLKKIEQLNKISELIKNNPIKKKELSDCKNHEEVICLTSKWGFEMAKDGENIKQINIQPIKKHLSSTNTHKIN